MSKLKRVQPGMVHRSALEHYLTTYGSPELRARRVGQCECEPTSIDSEVHRLCLMKSGFPSNRIFCDCSLVMIKEKILVTYGEKAANSKTVHDFRFVQRSSSGRGDCGIGRTCKSSSFSR